MLHQQRPSFSLSNIQDTNDFEKLLQVFDWVIHEIKAS